MSGTASRGRVRDDRVVEAPSRVAHGQKDAGAPSMNRTERPMRIGLGFDGTAPANESVALVRAAEQAKLDSVWSAEHLGLHDAVVASAQFLSQTQHIEVGIVGLNPFSRHPGLLAMELATLATSWPDRLRIQVGTGDPGLAARLGLNPLRSPLRDIECFVSTLRDLLGGQTRTVNAPSFTLRDFNVRGGRTLGAIPAVDVMAIRPKMLALGCRIGDGVSLSFGASRDYLRSTVENVEAALAAAGRDRDTFRISAWVQCFVDDDLDVATNRAARQLIHRVLSDSFAVLGAGTGGIADPAGLRSAFNADGPRHTAALLPAELVRALALVATPDTLAHALDEYRATGVDEVVLTMIGGSQSRIATIAQLGQLRTRPGLAVP